jgi:HKD family nuclease
MKIEVIPNKGPASVGPQLEELLDWSEHICIASAFATPASLDRIETALSQAQENSRRFEVYLLIGLYQRFTSARAIAKALRLQRTYPEMFSIRVARNNRFHWKLYIFGKGNSRKFFVGSANFTEDGLTASGELSVKITAQVDDSISRSLQAEFDTLWDSDRHSFSPGAAFLRNYRKLKRPPHVVRIPTDNSIGRLLYNAERVRKPPRPSNKPSGKVRPRLIFADRRLRQDTIDKISRYKNNWDEHDWMYFCTYRSDFEYTRNAGLLVYVTDGDDEAKSPDEYRIEFHRVDDSAVIQTRDGRYFVAHSRVPYTRSVKYGDVKRELCKVGRTWKKLRSDKFLNEEQIEALCQLLHVKWETLLQYLD